MLRRLILDSTPHQSTTPNSSNLGRLTIPCSKAGRLFWQTFAYEKALKLMWQKHRVSAVKDKNLSQSWPRRCQPGVRLLRCDISEIRSTEVKKLFLKLSFILRVSFLAKGAQFKGENEENIHDQSSRCCRNHPTSCRSHPNARPRKTICTPSKQSCEREYFRRNNRQNRGHSASRILRWRSQVLAILPTFHQLPSHPNCHSWFHEYDMIVDYLSSTWW